MLEVKLVNKSNNPMPEYATSGSAGMDVRAFIQTPLTIAPLARYAVPTGLYIELPLGYEAQLRPRSGWALKHGLTLLNTPGTIDADYRGEIRVIIANLSDTPFTIHPGDRICQMVITTHEQVRWVPTHSLDDTERGAGGFGHTGAR